MKQGDFEKFGQWLSTRMETVRPSPNQFTSTLRSSDGLHIKRFCDNQAHLQMKDRSTAAKLLRLRLDEFLIMLEDFHSAWVTKYDAFISNCLRYLLWRMEQNQQQYQPRIESLLSIPLEEIIEPVCAGRFDSTEDQRKVDPRKTKTALKQDKRGRPRQPTVLIHFLKSQLGVVVLFPQLASDLFPVPGWGLE